VTARHDFCSPQSDRFVDTVNAGGTIMASETPKVQEASPGSTPLRDLKLTIAGTSLEGVIQEFRQELIARGVTRLVPHFYLSTEWGVPFGTISIAIPFYLARTDLTALHAERGGHVEGISRADILRYLRHEMGHVVNYAYQLYETGDWQRIFGDIELPYVEEYHPRPFSREYVRNLPGWYAQKHPDEDWAETFAIWMTPGEDWRSEYADWPALGKLVYCDRVLSELRDRDPPITETDADEDVDELVLSLDEYYRSTESGDPAPGAGFDAVLRSIFQDRLDSTDETKTDSHAGAELIRQLQLDIPAEVYRWTGYFPERTRLLLRHLAERAERLKQVYSEKRRTEIVIALTTFITSLAMSHVLEQRNRGDAANRPLS
jgi:hypothetical protein